MLKNICLEIEYVGTAYYGFQIQARGLKRQVTVQGALEEALKKLFKKKIRIIYASRTDRGVHAKHQVVNFKVESRIPLAGIKSALNAFLPPDIRVKKAKLLPRDFHARFWAKSKIYRYIIHNSRQPSVFLHNAAWCIPEPLDVELMRKCASKVVGKKDFSLFAKGAGKYHDCTRNLESITIKKKGSLITVDLKADGFLHNMARNIVFFLVRVAKAKISLLSAAEILQGKRPYVAKPAPAGGLYLIQISYK
jgi:tRNA pseudouridine38-40 synthase